MEIETKAIITKEQFADLICRYANKSEHISKKDTYYSKYKTFEERKENNEPVIRIREENDKTYLTIKRKNIVNGVEQNEEIESEMSDIKAICEYFAIDHLEPYFTKTKESWRFTEVILNESPMIVTNDSNILEKWDSYRLVGHIEIEQINNKIFAVELEVIYNGNSTKESNNNLIIENTPIKTKEERIRDAIMNWFAKNSLENQIDNRSWGEILNE